MEIKVYLSLTSKSPVFVRQVLCDRSLDIDFNLLLKSMKILFGENCVVEFRCI